MSKLLMLVFVVSYLNLNSTMSHAYEVKRVCESVQNRQGTTEKCRVVAIFDSPHKKTEGKDNKKSK